MKPKTIFAICLALVAAFVFNRQQSPSETPASAPPSATARADDATLARAIATRAQDVQVSGHGTVVKLLADDRDGSAHQRFIVRLPSGDTVLVAHNIDLAPRVAPLAAGDGVEFNGEYAWNEKGGVVHWTHADPGGRHPAGWVRRSAR